MIWDRDLHAWIPRNPIVRRDLYHQKRTTSYRRGMLESFGIVAVALGFSAAMLFYVVVTLDPRGHEDYLDFIQLLAWGFHAVVILRLIAAGGLAAERDHSWLGSDELRLTPLSNTQLLIARWWAALYRVRGWMLALGIVQLGLVVSTAFAHLMTFDWSMTCLNPCVFTIDRGTEPAWFTATWSFFILVSVFGIVILETLCCTALGMVSALILRSKLGVVSAIFLRFAPVLIFSFVPDYSTASGNFMRRFVEYTWFSFADGGTGAMISLAHPIISFEHGVLRFCAVVTMFTFYLSLSLVGAWAVMQRSRP